MEWYEALLLGILQGLTEFLPISSSGHLVLARALFGIEGDYLFFDIVLHCGTLAAVVCVLWRECLQLFKPPFRTAMLVVVASVPAVVSALIFKDTIDQMFGDPEFLWIFFLLTAVLMFLTEWLAKKTPEHDSEDVSLKTAVIMGLAQSVAVFPGVSRSGSTIAGGVASGARRQSIAVFSFLMSLPIILGSVVLEGSQLTAIQPQPEMLVLGAVAAFASGFFAIKLMLRLIKNANYKWFGLYLLAISLLSLVMGTAD